VREHKRVYAQYDEGPVWKEIIRPGTVYEQQHMKEEKDNKEDKNSKEKPKDNTTNEEAKDQGRQESEVPLVRTDLDHAVERRAIAMRQDTPDAST